MFTQLTDSAKAFTFYGIAFALAVAALSLQPISAFTVTTSPLVTESLAGESGLLTILGYGLAAGWLLYRLNQRSRPVANPAVKSA